MPVTSSTTLMASTSPAARGSGKRVVNLTSARGWGVEVGPAGTCGALGVVENVGHLNKVIAHAWLLNARITMTRRIRREITERDFISLLNACTLIAYAVLSRNLIPLSGLLCHGHVPLSPGVGDITHANAEKV